MNNQFQSPYMILTTKAMKPQATNMEAIIDGIKV